MARFYIDTCIWRDYAENRYDRFRPLGDWAFRFMQQCLEREDEIIISELLLDELAIEYDTGQIKKILQIVSSRSVMSTTTQRGEAKALAKERNVPFGDALHAILARDTKAIIITRDRHFEVLRDIVLSKQPEELL